MISMDDKIEPSEKLYRMVLRKPDYWKKENGKPTSAVFKDSSGCSVDRDGQRPAQLIIDAFNSRFGSEKLKAIVCIEAAKCIEIGTYLLSCPTPDNEYHAEIHDSNSQKQIRSSKARKLAKSCNVVYVN